MASTSEGYIGIIDDEGLSTFTAKCQGVVSGGGWVVAGSNTLAASLSLSGGEPVFDSDYINITQGGSGTARPMGLALATTASGGYVAVMRAGLLICPANGTVTEGADIGATYVAGALGGVTDAAAAEDRIGMALTAQTSGTNNFALVRLNI